MTQQMTLTDCNQDAARVHGGSLHRSVGRLIRVFPRRTNATPTDELAFVGDPPFYAQADEVHVSVTFTWDLPEAERLAKAWQQVAPVKIGGPATGMRGEDFEPGKYMKPGYVITSRGCRNKCWFCSVWKRDGTLRELPIKDGWILNDDNILACSEPHIRAVFAMLKRQPKRAQFVGGLEAAILKPWHVELLAELKPAQLFCAYDTPDDYEPLVAAGKMLTEAGLKNALRCYVLIGWPKDTMEAAEVKANQSPLMSKQQNQIRWRVSIFEVIMQITRTMREKYKSRPYGNGMFDRRPAGGEDVIRLCKVVDSLEAIVRTMQHNLTTEQQNEIERMLWNIETSNK